MKEKRKLSEVFRLAAEYRTMSRGACNAIDSGISPKEYKWWRDSEPHKFFNELFRPKGNFAAYWFEREDGLRYSPPVRSRVEANNHRRTALLLAAEIAESEGL